MRLRTIIITATLLLLIGGAIAFFVTRPSQTSVRTFAVARQDVLQDVAFTGRLQPKQTSQLSFETIGAISAIYVAIGDIVTANTPLAQLSTTVANLNVSKTSADLAAAQEQSKITWQKAELAWQNTSNTNTSTIARLRQSVRDKKKELDQYRAIHEQVAREQGENDSTAATAVASVQAAQTAYHTSQQTLNENQQLAQASTAAARQAADLARAQYLATTQTSGSVVGLSSLEATTAIARHNLERQTIVAPFQGTITAVDKEVGETATTGETVVTVATIDQLELKANITETDAAKLTVNLPATVTFDALPPQEQWSAVIKKISPAAVISEGVPNYEITLLIDQPDSRFRAGLTANITVHADRRTGVIAIPRRAVATRGDAQFVQVLEPTGQTVERRVSTGLAGSTGTIEIINGLTEDDQVILETRQLEQ
ncbi:MAG: hypothetical protein A3G57_03685 [Candidatus Andersenbacteria bacterium RIFCSPLOWO2_12_FULL_45_8]|nr:MAG: Secretion protein HlyD [Parcubacteria group bacterium GW2011_GWA2_45_14]OGY35000.1 MAG: hypothetical protein A3B76_06090 [Candidatus Andersenbacteria bacterium RIFCSPHIGHO2_02_FULL_46_16]OGY38972.1 MAG: hypothetical protein A3G57_03685 [Candidatus Andersenbacteria bacterium RIFCSPLOWO2_12_FULL_45_8]HBE90585.1 hypothetical protein [Candidatus Andersenbacteria bacterium]